MIVDEKPSLEELAHHGIKGQKWGQHLATHASYSSRAQANDHRARGKGAVRRINKRLHAGMTLDEARHREDIVQQRKVLAIAGATIAVGLLAKHGDENSAAIASFIANKAAANREAANVISKTLAIGSTASKTPFVKAGRHGVFKITTL